MKHIFIYLFIILNSILSGCQVDGVTQRPGTPAADFVPFYWENANIYFLLTDRFFNGDPSNDVHFGRTATTAKLRGMMGGDLKGITQKITEGYFDNLGITAIWFTPVVEQNKGMVDEGTGPTYAYHGYWAQDWTALDPNFGTEKDLQALVDTAHAHGIRILLDVVINHTGPVTREDPVWPNDWVRTGPKCTFKSYATTVNCTLVDNLPDIRTERNTNTPLPPALLAKWKKEGRMERELAELNAFFKRTGHPRAPRFYLIKWLTDFIRQFGVDGFRVDTAKHIEETVWKELREEADRAFADWKKQNPQKVLDDNDFFMVGEVYNYNIATDTLFDIGDRKVNYFANGLNCLINFGFKYDGHQAIETTYSNYSKILQGPLKGKNVLNYISSHDDGQPFDRDRQIPLESATKLLLCPGASQIYYGDETARPLTVEGAGGDAHLRSFMNWDELSANSQRGRHTIGEILEHWQKIGRFRKEHPAVGAGVHTMISQSPYYFKRVFRTANGYTDAIVAGLHLPKGEKEVNVQGLFAEGETLREYYSGQTTVVTNGKIKINTNYPLVLFGKMNDQGNKY